MTTRNAFKRLDDHLAGDRGKPLVYAVLGVTVVGTIAVMVAIKHTAMPLLGALPFVGASLVGTRWGRSLGTRRRTRRRQ